MSLSELLKLVGSEHFDLLFGVDKAQMEHGTHHFYNGEQTVYLLAGLRLFVEAFDRLASSAPAANLSPDDAVAALARRESAGSALKSLRAEVARLEEIARTEETNPVAYAQRANARQREQTPSREIQTPWYRDGSMA